MVEKFGTGINDTSLLAAAAFEHEKCLYINFPIFERVVNSDLCFAVTISWQKMCGTFTISRAWEIILVRHTSSKVHILMSCFELCLLAGQHSTAITLCPKCSAQFKSQTTKMRHKVNHALGMPHVLENEKYEERGCF